jgi:hypothetical protein
LGLPEILPGLATPSLFYLRIYLERISKGTIEGEIPFSRCIRKCAISNPQTSLQARVFPAIIRYSMIIDAGKESVPLLRSVPDRVGQHE